MEKLTKQNIINKIKEAQKSSVLKGDMGLDRTWTINELIYCLELIQGKTDLMFNINIENTGMSIPVAIHVPIWVNISSRAKRVKIVDVEIEEVTHDSIDNNYEYADEIDYVYLIIVKEVE